MKQSRLSKRLLTMLLCAALLLSMLPTYALAAEADAPADAVSSETVDEPAAEAADGQAEAGEEPAPAEEAEATLDAGPASAPEEPANAGGEAAGTPAAAAEAEAEAPAGEDDAAAADPQAEGESSGADNFELPQAGPLAGGATSGQPLAAGTGGSTLFRIPAVITLQNGWLAAAADARYSTSGDGGGLDTIVSISKDNGATWEYSFPLYFPDSDGYYGNQATTIIDPALVQGGDGTLYLIADVNPTGTTTMGGYTFPGTGTGYINVNGVERLALTDNYANTNTAPTDDDIATYPYYVGDLSESGYAPVISRATGEATGYVVDEWCNLFQVNPEDGSVIVLTQTQVNTSDKIKQNVFYRDSELHVFNTGYMWLVSSKDNGKTWHMLDLNPQIKRDTESGLLVSPGRGTLLRDGTIIIPFYNHWDSASSTPSLEHSSFIWSKDNGATWHRTDDVPGSNGYSSECELVELADGTLRLFVRSGTNAVAYADAAWDGTNYVWETAVVSTGVPARSGCNVSAIMYSEQIDGKDAILVACPSNPNSRTAGRIFVFLVDEDNSMTLGYTFVVNESSYAYSCLTEQSDGKVGLLWEYAAAAITYSTYDITDIASGAVINNERVLTVPLYGTLIDTVPGDFEPDPMPDGSIVSVKTEKITGAQAILGSDYTFSGGTVPLSDCLYTFTGDSTNGWTVQSVSDPTIYLNHGVKAGFPGANTASAIRVEDGNAGGYSLVTTAPNGSNTRLFFWKTTSSGKTYSFDRQGSLDATGNGRTDFLFYRPVKDGEESSAEIPGCIRVTKDQIVSGEQYLIVAQAGDQYFVLYPSASTTDRYAHVAKVGGSDTVTQITYTGNQDGTVTFTDRVTGYHYTVNVVAMGAVEVPVVAGKTVTLDVKGNEVSREADSAIADAKVVTVDNSGTYTGCQGNLGSDSSYSGALVAMSRALYTFTANDDGSYLVSGRTANGAQVYLGLRSGQAGYPQTTDAGSAGAITVSAFGDSAHNFYIRSDGSGYNGYLYFHNNDAKAFRFDQQQSYQLLDQLKFQIFRAAKAGEQGTVIPGYIQVVDAKEIVSGERYLIVREFEGAYYALYPSTSTSDYYAHVVKVNPDSELVTETITDTKHTLTITGVAPGTTDCVVNGIIYRITVTEPTGEEPSDTIGKNFPNGVINTTDSDNTWMFDGGATNRGSFAEIRGTRSYIYQFEEYVRWTKASNSAQWVTRQRYVFNVGKTGQTLADSLAAFDERVAALDPRVAVYLVGPEDYNAGPEGLEAFKANLTAYVDKALALRGGTGFAVVQTPVPVAGADNTNAELYAKAVRYVLYNLGSEKDINVQIVDHFASTEWSAEDFNADGSLSSRGHLEMGRQLCEAVCGTLSSYPSTTVSANFPELVECDAPEAYLDDAPTVVSGTDSLTVTLPETAVSESWNVEVETDSYTLTTAVGESEFTICNLPAGEDYVLTITAEDWSVRLPVMAGTITDGGKAAVRTNPLNANQQAIVDLAKGDEPVTWLFMGDSITHGALWMGGYDSITQSFEKFLRDDLGREDDLVINTAVSSATTDDTIQYLEYRLNKYQPDVVTIMLGTNDSNKNLGETAYKNNLRRIIDAAQAKGALVVLRTPICDKGNNTAIRGAYAGYMRDVAAEYDDVILIDQYTMWSEMMTRSPYLANYLYGSYSNNPLHPVTTGQLLMMRQFLEGTGLSVDNSYLEALRYESGTSYTTSTLAPEVFRKGGTVTLDAAALAQSYGSSFSEVTMTAVDGVTGYTYTVSGTGTLTLSNLPGDADLTVNVSAHLKTADTVVDFVSVIPENLTKLVELKVGEVYTDTLDGDLTGADLSGVDQSIAKVTLTKNTLEEGSETALGTAYTDLGTGTYSGVITDGTHYLVLNEDGSFGAAEDIGKATRWTVTYKGVNSNRKYYNVVSDGAYLTFKGAEQAPSVTTNGIWFYNEQNNSFYVTSSGKTYYLQYSDNGWVTTTTRDTSAAGRLYSFTEGTEPIVNTTVTITGVYPGTTELVLGNRTYQITVSGLDYTVTLNPGNGGESTQITVTQGKPVGPLPTPVREGYTFTGWYDAEGNLVTEETVYTVAGDSELTAGWTANEYTITLDDGEKTSELTVTYGEAVGELPTPEREGYTFTGWYDAEGNLVTEETVYTVAGNSKLTAGWTANEYTITLDDGEKTSELTVTYGEAIGELPTPVREGYTFTGWYDENGNLVSGETVYQRAGDTKLTAKWTANAATDPANPTKPAEPTKPADGGKPATTPQTGDNSAVTLSVMLLSLSAAVLALFLADRKRRAK